MKKWLMRTLLKLAIAIALWSMDDRTKTKISRSVADRIAQLYRKMKEKSEETVPEPLPDAREDSAKRRPIRGLIRRLRGLVTGSPGDKE